MKHLHHIIPKHMGGSDHPSNLIELTIEEHAEEHKLLYWLYNNEYDRIAWQSLSGQITTAEATTLASIHHNKTRSYRTSEKTKHKLREASIKNGNRPPIGPNNGSFKNGDRSWNKGKTGIYSEETLKSMSEKHKGNKYALGVKRSEDTKQKISSSRKGKGTGQSNAMANEKNRMKVSASKVGRKRVYREDGSFYMSKRVG